MTYKPPDDATIDALVDRLKFNPEGLIAAIAQSAQAPHEVLMMAWMNRDALRETLATGKLCYYSRRRKTLWRKGETSGQTQTLVAAFLDCDRDALLLKIQQKGVACHTGRKSCFYREITASGLSDATDPLISPEQLYHRRA